MSPVSILKQVVFPAPLIPRRAKHSPSGMAKETSFTATLWPENMPTLNTFLMLWILIVELFESLESFSSYLTLSLSSVTSSSSSSRGVSFRFLYSKLLDKKRLVKN